MNFLSLSQLRCRRLRSVTRQTGVLTEKYRATTASPCATQAVNPIPGLPLTMAGHLPLIGSRSSTEENAVGDVVGMLRCASPNGFQPLAVRSFLEVPCWAVILDQPEKDKI